MRTEIEQFESGWCSLEIAMSSIEIDQLVTALKQLKQSHNHFHARSNFQGKPGIGDILFTIENESKGHNLTLDLSRPYYPKDL